jgi:hypothetical protein
MTISRIAGLEVAEVMRAALRGEVQVRLADDNGDGSKWTWNDVYAGNCGFWFGEWQIVFFNDCGELDYTDWARSPDGRQTSFDAWWDEHDEPVSLLSMEELAAMEELLENVRA